MNKNDETKKKLVASVVLIVILSICLCITSVALVFSTVAIRNNNFYTGNIKLNLNDGKPVIEEYEFFFEPGMTVVKEFFVENKSTWEVYYRIYLDNISGGLADVLEVTIRKGDEVICTGTANELTRKKVPIMDDTLRMDQRETFTITFHFPEDAGNSSQNHKLNFDLCADAVQTKNNPYRLFDQQERKQNNDENIEKNLTRNQTIGCHSIDDCSSKYDDIYDCFGKNV